MDPIEKKVFNFLYYIFKYLLSIWYVLYHFCNLAEVCSLFLISQRSIILYWLLQNLCKLVPTSDSSLLLSGLALSHLSFDFPGSTGEE